MFRENLTLTPEVIMRFFPKQEDFFEHFRVSAGNILEAAKFLAQATQGVALSEDHLKRLEEFEHQGDKITHDTMERLNRTFITPIDREDIHALISRLDDILDFIYSAAEALALYKISPIPNSMKDLTALLVHVVAEVERAVERLSNLKRPEMILAICIEINRLENEIDNAHRRALANLFENGKDPILIIKTKEILEDLESAADKCEDVANVIEGIVLKNA